MPFTWCIDHERELVIGKSDGAISPGDLEAYYAEAFGTPKTAAYDELGIGIGDGSPTVDVNAQQFERAMRLRRRHSSGRRARSAICLPADAAYGGGRVGAAVMSLGDAVDFTVVRSLVEALAVLELPEDYDPGV